MHTDPIYQCSNAAAGRCTQIHELMLKTGMTGAQVALLFSVNERTIRRWRSGESPTPLAATLVLSIILKHGMTTAATLGVPELEKWVTTMVLAMSAEGQGLCGIQRNLGVGYGVAARIIDGVSINRRI